MSPNGSELGDGIDPCSLMTSGSRIEHWYVLKTNADGDDAGVYNL
jgi:hypothetical protein